MNFLKEHKESLYDLRKSNPLLDLPFSKFPSVQIDTNQCIKDCTKTEYKKIFKKSDKNLKSFGLRTLLTAGDCLRWTYRNTIICSPIYLRQVTSYKIKGNQVLTYEVESEKFTNPVLDYLLSLEFGFNINDDSFLQLIQKNNFEIIEGSWIGNFDYKKYKLVDDYNHIKQDQFSPVLKTLINGEKKTVCNDVKGIRNILPLDASQEAVLIAALNQKNVLLEGPPGTGKSRTIANIIGQNLFLRKSCLFVAEKRSALTVVSSILQENKLGNLTSVIHDSEADKARFIDELKESWEFFLVDQKTPTDVIHSRHQLEFILEKLNSTVIGSSIKYQTLINLLSNDSTTSIKLNFSPSISLIEDWLDNKQLISQAYQSIQTFNRSNFSETPVRQLNQHLFLAVNVMDKIEASISSFLSHLEKIEPLTKYEVLSSLSNLVKVSSISRLVVSNPSLDFKSLSKISFRKVFKKKRKTYLLLQSELKAFDSIKDQWNQIWSLQEVSSALLTLNNTSLLKQKARKDIERSFGLHFEQKNIIIPINQVLAITKDYWELTFKINTLEAELKADYSIDNISIQLDLINEIVTYFEHSDIELLNWFKNTKDIDSIMKLLDKHHTDVQQILHFNKLLFNIDREDQIESIKKQVSLLQSDKNLPQIAEILVPLAKYCKKETFQLITSIACDFNVLNKSLIETFYLNRSQSDAEFYKINEGHLTDVITRQLYHEKEFSDSNIDQILHQSKQKFDKYCAILETPASKLKGAQKDLKKRLRKGKSILNKEFGKQRSHMSIRLLMETEAIEWIEVLKPVLFMSPISVSEIFPLDRQFAQVIFDEASQIPLEDCIPCLQRAGQVIIAGDSQQMPPSNYFQSNRSEQFSLLSYCKYEFDNFLLKYHYRSNHQELIEFSNIHFYHDQLKAISSPEKNFEPLTLIQLENNDYHEGANLAEAEAIIAYLSKNMSTYTGLQIGIFALSEKQTLLIKELLDENIELKLFLKKSNSFVRSLENLQGEECDISIISLTHGPNSEGKFSLNFGPINNINGKKRLNVLFTRAKEQMITFCSFKSKNLTKSENEGIKTLGLFLEFCQENSQTNDIHQNNKILISDPHLKFEKSNSLISFVNLYRTKGWIPSFNLTKSNF